jgi:hypothetical protein
LAEEKKVEPGEYQLEIIVDGASTKEAVRIVKGAGASLKVISVRPNGLQMMGSVTKEGSFMASGAINNQLTILIGRNPTADLIEGEARVGPLQNKKTGSFSLMRIKK